MRDVPSGTPARSGQIGIPVVSAPPRVRVMAHFSNAFPHLVEFFHCYSCALPAMHGMDQSVSELTLAEVVVARQVLELDKKV